MAAGPSSRPITESRHCIIDRGQVMKVIQVRHADPLEQRLPDRYLAVVGIIVQRGEHAVGHTGSILKRRVEGHGRGHRVPALFEPGGRFGEIEGLYVEASEERLPMRRRSRRSQRPTTHG